VDGVGRGAVRCRLFEYGLYLFLRRITSHRDLAADVLRDQRIVALGSRKLDAKVLYPDTIFSGRLAEVRHQTRACPRAALSGPHHGRFCAYVGYRLRGVPRAVLAAAGFILPTLVLMLVLSALYFAAGALFIRTNGGNEGPKRVHSPGRALGEKNDEPHDEPDKGARAARTGPVSVKQWAGIGLVVATILAVVGFSWFIRSDTGELALSMFKIGAVAFGNGTTILPLVQANTVDAHQWLTMSQFADGIALSQITPGPFLIIAAFIGFKVGGILGGLLATFAMFSPSIAMTLIFTEVFSRLRNLKPVRGALSGVLAAFVGMLASVVLQLGTLSLTGPAPLALSAAAFVGVRWLKLEVLWVFLGGLLLWVPFC